MIYKYLIVFLLIVSIAIELGSLRPEIPAPALGALKVEWILLISQDHVDATASVAEEQLRILLHVFKGAILLQKRRESSETKDKTIERLFKDLA